MRQILYKELKLKEGELQAKLMHKPTPVLPLLHPLVIKMPILRSYHSVVEEKDELDSYLLRFERYTENASWEKDTWDIKLSALLTGRAMDVYTKMSDTDASDYDKLKKSLLTRYSNTEDGYRKRFREATPEILSQRQILGTGNLPQDSAWFVLILISLQRWQHGAHNETKHCVSQHLIGPLITSA